MAETSRFWAADSDSDSDSGNSSDSSVIEEVKPNVVRSRWAVDSESEDEGGTRIVRTSQDRATEALSKTAAELTQKIKINDWNAIVDTFGKLNKQLPKVQKTNKGTPRVYLKAMILLDGTIKTLAADKGAIKKLSKTNGKSFNAMKLRFKHHVTQYAEEMENLPESESESSSSDNSSSDDSSSSDSSSDSSDSSSDSDSDSDEWSDSSSSSSSSEEETQVLTGRARWVKRAVTTKVKDRKPAKEPKKRADDKEVKAATAERQQEKKEPEVEFTIEMLDERIMQIVSSRGKRGTKLSEQIKSLRRLSEKAVKFGPERLVPVLMHLVSAQFDKKKGIDEHMNVTMWRQVVRDIKFIMRILDSDHRFIMGSVEQDVIGAMAVKKADKTASTEAATGEIPVESEVKSEEPIVIRVVGDLTIFVERLESEYTQSLRNIDPHVQEYIDRLADEGDLISLAKEVQEYLERVEDHKKAARMALLVIEHIYYKHDSIAAPVHAAQHVVKVLGQREFFHPGCIGAPAFDGTVKLDPANVHPAAALGAPGSNLEVPEFDAHKEMNFHCTFLYKFGDDRGKCRAMLCHIYHHAIHDRFYKARDLLFMSRLQDTISNVDIPTQILFNRMMAQLGLCAFRQGLIKEAHNCLTEICGMGRAKELLAQGLAWRNARYERNPEQEKAEKRRLVPYHTHINLELLECCHLTAAMLLEIPHMAVSEFDSQSQVISKPFRRLMDNYATQVFTGPPENTRDHVMAAANSLRDGDWKMAYHFIDKLNVWNLVPHKEQVKEMLRAKIKQEALRTYMLTYSPNYDSILTSQLCELFDLPKGHIQSVVSKMMINNEIRASWDQPTDSIVLHRVEATHLQALALQFADKALLLVENNENQLDRISGGGWKENSRGNNRSPNTRGRGRGKGRGRGRGRNRNFGGKRFNNNN